jgi:pimeloyl-ACP methyl ester carboxylesterase
VDFPRAAHTPSKEVNAVIELSTGAELRVTGPRGERAVVCVNGGQAADVPGTWSASLDWLVRRLAPRFPGLAFGEVKYRIKSWKRLDLCTEDALAAIDELGAERTLLIGFSMGGAVAIKAARNSTVNEVVGLAPWIPDRLDLSPLDGRRLAVFHGSLDRYFPGIPGVNPSNSRRGYERAKARGIEASYTLIPGALHGIAVRGPWGKPIPLPRARAWAGYAASAVENWSARG